MDSTTRQKHSTPTKLLEEVITCAAFEWKMSCATNLIKEEMRLTTHVQSVDMFRDALLNAGRQDYQYEYSTSKHPISHPEKVNARCMFSQRHRTPAGVRRYPFSMCQTVRFLVLSADAWSTRKCRPDEPYQFWNLRYEDLNLYVLRGTAPTTVMDSSTKRVRMTSSGLPMYHSCSSAAIGLVGLRRVCALIQTIAVA